VTFEKVKIEQGYKSANACYRMYARLIPFSFSSAVFISSILHVLPVVPW